MIDIHKINDALRQDAETIPPTTPRNTVRTFGSKRLNALADALMSKPQDKDATRLYLQEFIGRTQKQVAATICLFSTFAQRYAESPDTVLEAMPPHTKAALSQLAALARTVPIPCPDAGLVSHALTIDGAFCGLVSELSGEKPRRQPDARDAYRRLAQRLHPDKGGDPAVMADINALHAAARRA